MDTRKQFGNRRLKENENVFKHNAWDDVRWDEKQEKNASDCVERNSTVTMSEAERCQYEMKADMFWDEFYCVHNNKFFKDRHWLFTEFPELKNHEASLTSISETDTIPKFNIFEVGCGVGNTIFPILKYNTGDKLHLFGCDFSHKAINILRENKEFDQKRCHVFVLDLTKSEDWEKEVPFLKNSIDVIVMIFVLSAIHPDKMQTVLGKCFEYLKPGGLLLFRDYGLYDLAQLRIKPGKCLQRHFYVRGDGTRVYFFQQDEIKYLFEGCGFTEELNLVDRRLQVNRGKELKMYRVFVTGKFRKPASIVGNSMLTFSNIES